jgi:hypothetical protein
VLAAAPEQHEDGELAFRAARSVAKSVSAETITRFSASARSKISGSLAACMA